MLQFVSICNTWQSLNYGNINTAGKLIPIKETHLLKSTGLDLTPLYLVSNPEIYVLVTVNYFINWVEFIYSSKSSVRAINRAFTYNFVLKYH